MTPEQFDAIRAQEMAGDAAIWRTAGTLAAYVVLAIVVAGVALLLHDRHARHRHHRDEMAEWEQAQRIIASWSVEFPDDCDRSYTCPADPHVPGCYADGYHPGLSR
jgi:hypothetical protein